METHQAHSRELEVVWLQPIGPFLRFFLCRGLFSLPIGFEHRGLIFRGDDNSTENGVCAAFSEFEARYRFRKVKSKLSCDLRRATIYAETRQ